MKNIAIVLFVSTLATIICVGCSGKKRPSDLPPLSACKITITQDSVPLAGANVTLRSDSVSWAVGGVTNDEGVATIFTHGDFSGAPNGEYKVLVSKTVVEGLESPGASTSASATMNARVTSYDFVDLQYKTAENSPLTLKVSGKTTQTFDVGAAIRTEIPRL